jgi:3'(2'), 5'-bisphosphate nucleotidase
MSSRNEIVQLFAAIAVQAGQAIMRLRPALGKADEKADGSPVTEADIEADRLIRSRLAEALPSLPIISEEARQTHSPGEAERFVLVDPLDGTREFIAGRDEFTVNIALVENGIPVVGAIVAPALSRLYVGSDKARRAEISGAAAVPALSEMTEIAAAALPETGWRAVASRSHRDPQTQAWLDGNPVWALCEAGSSLKFCALAQGDADVYPRLAPTMAWDIAAGHAILRAAGGRVETLDGQEMRYDPRVGLQNPSFVAWGRRTR